MLLSMSLHRKFSYSAESDTLRTYIDYTIVSRFSVSLSELYPDSPKGIVCANRLYMQAQMQTMNERSEKASP